MFLCTNCELTERRWKKLIVCMSCYNVKLLWKTVGIKLHDWTFFSVKLPIFEIFGWKTFCRTTTKSCPQGNNNLQKVHVSLWNDKIQNLCSRAFEKVGVIFYRFVELIATMEGSWTPINFVEYLSSVPDMGKLRIFR